MMIRRPCVAELDVFFSVEHSSKLVAYLLSRFLKSFFVAAIFCERSVLKYAS